MLEKLKKLYRFSNTWTGTIVIVLLAIFFFAQAFVIPSGSMKKTYAIGDFLLVKKFSYGIPIPTIPILEIRIMPDIFGNGHLIEGDRPERGDITVFRYPHNPDIHYVKRCVAVGGDLVMLRDKDLYIRPHEGNEFVKNNYLPDLIVEDNMGNLWVKNPYKYKHKGITHDDSITKEAGIFPSELFDFGPVKVPEDSFFMMGDNREHSNDSRSWGSVPYKYIVGTPWITYLSWENRSYNDVLRGSELTGADHIDLKAVCDDIPIESEECEERWTERMYEIRWERMFKTPEGLEELIE